VKIVGLNYWILSGEKGFDQLQKIVSVLGTPKPNELRGTTKVIEESSMISIFL